MFHHQVDECDLKAQKGGFGVSNGSKCSLKFDLDNSHTCISSMDKPRCASCPSAILAQISKDFEHRNAPSGCWKMPKKSGEFVARFRYSFTGTTSTPKNGRVRREPCRNGWILGRRQPVGLSTRPPTYT